MNRQMVQIGILTGPTPGMRLANRGYRGVQASVATQTMVSNTQTLPRAVKILRQRLQLPEPMIVHTKKDGLLFRTWLKAARSDATHAVRCGSGQNLWLMMPRQPVPVCALVGELTLPLMLGKAGRL